MQNRPQDPRQQQQAYVDSVMKTFADDPGKLNPLERQLAEKCAKIDGRIGALLTQISTQKTQIEQGQARLRNLELTVEREQGTVNGFVELLVEAKFGTKMEDGPKKAPKSGRKGSAKGSPEKAPEAAQEAPEEAA